MSVESFLCLLPTANNFFPFCWFWKYLSNGRKGKKAFRLPCAGRKHFSNNSELWNVVLMMMEMLFFAFFPLPIFLFSMLSQAVQKRDKKRCPYQSNIITKSCHSLFPIMPTYSRTFSYTRRYAYSSPALPTLLLRFKVSSFTVLFVKLLDL